MISQPITFPAHTAAIAGYGPPSDLIGSCGNLYVNMSNADVYAKRGDAWLQVRGSNGNISGYGPPTGIVTPAAVDQIYFDTNGVSTTAYRATGLASTDWKQFV